MVRCMFCGKNDFINLDEVWLHEISLKNDGRPVCPKMSLCLDANNYDHHDGYGVLR